jgi:hypothetical protein
MSQPLRIGLPSFDEHWQPASNQNLHGAARTRTSLLDSTFLLRLQTLKQSLGLDPMIHEIVAKISSTMKSLGGTLVAHLEDLTEIPLKELALRIEPIQGDAMPSLEAIESADGLEFQLENLPLHYDSLEARTSLQPLSIAWPIDVSSLDIFQKKVDFLRSLSDSPTPVGMSLPMTSSVDHLIEDFGWLKDLSVDFITVRTPQALLADSHPANSLFSFDWFAQINLLRRLLDESMRIKTRLFVDHPWNHGYEAAQAVLAGANGVFLHAYLSQHLVKSLSQFSLIGDDPLLSAIEQTQTKRRLAAKIVEWLAEWDSNNPIQRFAAEFQALMDIAPSGKISKP